MKLEMTINLGSPNIGRAGLAALCILGAFTLSADTADYMKFETDEPLTEMKLDANFQALISDIDLLKTNAAQTGAQQIVTGGVTVSSSEVWLDTMTLNLPAGTWDITAIGRFGGGGNPQAISIGISTTVGAASPPDLVPGHNHVAGGYDGTPAGFSTLTIPAYRVTVGATTPFYLKAFVGTGTAGVANFNGRMSAVRIY